jgi:membrane-associated phospholipid phosphatase
VSDPSPLTPWYRQAAATVPRHFYLKSIGTTVFISLFFILYFHVLRNPAYPTTVMPAIWIDHWIDFEPLALPVYLSLWLYVSLLPAFFAARAELYRYGLAMALMCVSALLIFYFWPTAAPTPDIDWARYPSVNFLKNIDASGNAFPSLHVATAFYSGFWMHRLLRRFGGPLWIHGLNWGWCMAIIYSTLAIRQHVAVDAVAGMVLGGAVAWLSLRRGLFAQQPLKTELGAPE